MSEALTAESLSGPLRSVAERLGMPFVFRLVEHFGGTTVAIPSGSAGKKQYRRLCAALGDESASALCREFARRAIYIPNLKKAMLCPVLQMLWFGVLPCHHAINAHFSHSAASNRKLHGHEG